MTLKFGDSYECSYGSNNKTDEVTLWGTNISHPKGSFEDDFPFLKVGYVLVPWSVIFFFGACIQKGPGYKG